MRTKLANWTRMAVVVVTVFGTQTGCKSGWKMPGADMFPWSKKPSESTLAGSSPSLSMPSNNPTSTVGPAYKNSPSPLVSNAANPSRTPSPYGAVNSGSPSINMPPNNPMANNGSGVSAGANGYATGPYNMAGNTNRTGGFTPPTGYGAPPQSPNGYGTATNPNALAGLPPAYGGAGLPPAPNNSATYAPMGNASIPALPAAYNSAAVNSMPQSSMPNALPNSFQPSSLPSNSANGPAVAAQTYTGAAPYRPGSVGRQTSYDFSNQGAGASGLPPASVPTTANGLPNGSPNGMFR